MVLQMRIMGLMPKKTGVEGEVESPGSYIEAETLEAAVERH